MISFRICYEMSPRKGSLKIRCRTFCGGVEFGGLQCLRFKRFLMQLSTKLKGKPFRPRRVLIFSNSKCILGYELQIRYARLSSELTRFRLPKFLRFKLYKPEGQNFPKVAALRKSLLHHELVQKKSELSRIKVELNQLRKELQQGRKGVLN